MYPSGTPFHNSLGNGSHVAFISNGCVKLKAVTFSGGFEGTARKRSRSFSLIF